MNETTDMEIDEYLEPEWCQVLPIGAGLENVGNTCCVNSVLQCLAYTPPLVNYMISREHSRKCKNSGLCMICTVENHIIHMFTNSGCIMQPNAVIQPLNRIGWQFQLGVMQDAHEFLMCMLEAMHQSYLKGCMLNKQITERSLIDQIFVSHLQSTVACTSCGFVSKSFEIYRNIPLFLKGGETITEAFRQNHMPEQLGSDYKCFICKEHGHAFRKVGFIKLSPVLVICLKLCTLKTAQSVQVRYPEILDMRPFMCHPDGQPEVYKLYGVLVLSGHFYCYVMSSTGQWLQMDDSSVSLSDRQSALSQQPFLLFYVRSEEQRSVISSTHVRTSPGQNLCASTSTPNTAWSTSPAPSNDSEKSASSSSCVNQGQIRKSGNPPKKLNRQGFLAEGHHPKRRGQDRQQNEDVRQITAAHDIKQSCRKRRRDPVSEKFLEEFSPKKKRMTTSDRTQQNLISTSTVHTASAGLVKVRRGHKRHLEVTFYEDTYGPKRAPLELLGS